VAVMTSGAQPGGVLSPHENFKTLHNKINICRKLSKNKDQARNQLGTPGGEKSFLREGKIFKV